MNTEREKFLTEAMGECWHSFEGSITGRECVKCGAEFWANEIETANKKHNFSTWEGFVKLITWIRQQEWYERFHVEMNESVESWRNYLINPDEFADTVYEYLKGRGKWRRQQRVACPVCFGSGFESSEVQARYGDNVECTHCQGKGFKEAINE